MNWRHWVLLLVAAGMIIGVFLFPAIPQDQAYHDFADKRAFWGVPNSLDVLSNVFFLFVGLLSIRFILRDRGRLPPSFIEPAERWPYLIFFLCVAITAFGSAYYHLDPNDARLVWDRIPIALVCMALLAAVLGERISISAGTWLLMPLMVVGAGSVLYWQKTQAAGHGDLRPYVLVQFGSTVILLFLLVLFPARYTRGADFVVSGAFYGLAKIFEFCDRQIFSLGGIVSGHTLKHVTAAISGYWILRMLRLRKPVTFNG